MSHKWRSHVPHTNESCATHERVMSHIEMRTSSTDTRPWPPTGWVLSHIWMCHVPHMNEDCSTYEWVMSHIWTRHVTREDPLEKSSFYKIHSTHEDSRADFWECLQGGEDLGKLQQQFKALKDAHTTSAAQVRVEYEDTHMLCSHLRVSRVTAKFCATKRAAGMDCLARSWDREISRFAEGCTHNLCRTGVSTGGGYQRLKITTVIFSIQFSLSRHTFQTSFAGMLRISKNK